MPTERQNQTCRPPGSWREYSMCRFGMSYGQSRMPSTPNSSTPSGGSFMKCDPSMIEGEATLAVKSVATPFASKPPVIFVTEAGR